MFAVFTGDKYGALTWCSTVDTKEDAEGIANEALLEVEETVMVIEVFAFRQNA